MFNHGSNDIRSLSLQMINKHIIRFLAIYFNFVANSPVTVASIEKISFQLWKKNTLTIHIQIQTSPTKAIRGQNDKHLFFFPYVRQYAKIFIYLPHIAVICLSQNSAVPILKYKYDTFILISLLSHRENIWKIAPKTWYGHILCINIKCQQFLLAAVMYVFFSPSHSPCVCVCAQFKRVNKSVNINYWA